MLFRRLRRKFAAKRIKEVLGFLIYWFILRIVLAISLFSFARSASVFSSPCFEASHISMATSSFFLS